MNAGAAAEEARLQREWFPEAVPGLFRVSKAEAAADLDVIQASLMRFQQQPQPPSAEAPIDRASKKSRLIEKIFRDATPHHLQREEHANLRAVLDQVRADTLSLKDAMSNVRRDHALAIRERIAHDQHLQSSREDMLATVGATESARALYADALLTLRRRLDLAHDDADVARSRLEDARTFAVRMQTMEQEQLEQRLRFDAVCDENAAMQDLLRGIVDAMYRADAKKPVKAKKSAAKKDGAAAEGNASSSAIASADVEDKKDSEDAKPADAVDTATKADGDAAAKSDSAAAEDGDDDDDDAEAPVDAILRVLSAEQVAILREIAQSKAKAAAANAVVAVTVTDGDAADADAAKAEGAEKDGASAEMSDLVSVGPLPTANADGAVKAEASSSSSSSSDSASASASEQKPQSQLVTLLGPPSQTRGKRAREDGAAVASNDNNNDDNSKENGDGAGDVSLPAATRRRFAYEAGLEATGDEGLEPAAAAALSAETRAARKSALESHARLLDFEGVFDSHVFFSLLRRQVDHILELQATLGSEAVRSAELADEVAVGAQKIELLTAEAEKVNGVIARLRDVCLQQELAIVSHESRTQAVLQELDLVRREKSQLEAQKVADDIKYRSLVDCLAAADVRSVEAENAVLDSLHELRVLRTGNATLQTAFDRLSRERNELARTVVELEDRSAASAGAAGAAEAAAESTGADATALALRLQKQLATTRALTSELKAAEDAQRLQQKEIKKLQKQLADIMGTRIGEQIEVLEVLEPKAAAKAAALTAANAAASTTASTSAAVAAATANAAAASDSAAAAAGAGGEEDEAAAGAAGSTMGDGEVRVKKE